MRASVLFIASMYFSIQVPAQWTRVNAVPASDVASVIVRGTTIYAGTDSAIYISPDGGTTWTRSATIPNSPMLVDAIGVFDGKLFAGTGGKGVYMSSNNGQSWQALSQGLTGTGSTFISSFAERSGILYAATMGGGVFALQQNVWVQVGDLQNLQAGNVYSLLVKGDTLLAAAGGNGYVWILPPGATSWRGVQIAPFAGQAHIINSLTIWNGAILAGGSYSVYRSTDNAETWEFSGFGLTVNNTVNFAPLGTMLYSSFSTVNTRIYRSVNGRDWDLVESIPFTYSIASAGSKLYAARYDGLWFNQYTTTAVQEDLSVPERIALHQNYPNPFNPETVIRFELPSASQVSLTVYNSIGQKIATIINGHREAGAHRVTWNSGNLPGGVYFYRLLAKGSVATRQMLVLK